MRAILEKYRDRLRAMAQPASARAFHRCEVVIERTFADPALQALEDARETIVSQHGEEGILRAIFSKIGTTNKVACEFGAWDGKYLSNTWDLLENRGWRGVLIEGDTARAADLPKSYSAPERHTFITGFVGWTGPDRLDALLERAKAPRDLDLLSVDIDGNDWHVLAGMEAFTPRVVIVEINPSIPNEVAFVQAADSQISQGASLRAMRDLMREKGYELAFVTETNGIFVLLSEYSKIGIISNALHILNPALLSGLHTFELFDGNVVRVGRERLLWKRRRSVADALQTVITVTPEDMAADKTAGAPEGGRHDQS